MSKEPNNEISLDGSDGSGRSRHDILKLMRENKPLFKGKKKKPAKPPPKIVKASFEKIANDLNIIPGKSMYSLLKYFYDDKKASTSDCKVMVERTKNLTDEQLKILKLLCKKPNFSVVNILDFTKLIKLFGLNRILVLRVFVDLDDVDPSTLFQFFITNLPQGNRKKMGEEVWEKELLDKMMTHEQINVFYTVCYQVPEVTTRTAIKVLPKIRELKQQHAKIINAFLKKESTFGDAPITIKNISGLLNLWMVIPELEDKNRFKWLMKKLSHKLDKQQPDLQMIIHYLKEELEHEKKGSFDNVLLSIRNLF